MATELIKEGDKIQESKDVLNNIEGEENLAERKANADKLKKIIESTGADVGSALSAMHNVSRVENPTQPSGFEDSYVPNRFANEQGLADDFIEAVYEGLVVNTIEGFGNLIPTVSQAFGVGSEDKLHENWTSQWINSVSKFADSISPTYSDEYYRSAAAGDLFSARSIAHGLGQGVGFVGGIMLGGANIGKLVSKGAQTANTVRNGQRVGSFIMGTNMMYPMVYEEAIKKGIEPAHAARLSLGISGIVSLTEGAALEWIGKVATKPVLNNTTKNILKNELKGLGKIKNLSDVNLATKKVVTGLSNKLKGMKVPVLQGAAIETGQEFSQTYIEEGLKQLYDNTVAFEKKEGKGKFGSEIRPWTEKGYETFWEATFGGFIGGIIGGGIPIAGSIGKPVHQETLFNYINHNVNKSKKKNLNNVSRLFDSVKKLSENGDITPEHAVKARENLSAMVAAAETNKKLGLKDNISGMQIYQLSEIDTDISKNIKDKFKESDDLPQAISQSYSESRLMGEEISKSINQDMSDIISNNEPFTKRKDKFEKRLSEYKSLAAKVYNSSISKEDFNSELEKISNTKSDLTTKLEKAKQKAEKDKAKAVEYKTKEGATITESAMQDAESILKGYNAALDISPEAEAEFQAKLKEEYGIEKEGLRFLIENEGSTVEKMKSNLEATEVAEKKETKVKKVKAYRTEGTEMGKLDTAFRGTGKYYALDKPFTTGKEGEVVTESQIEIDESKSLDLTKSQETGKEDADSKKYSEIRKEAKKRFDAIPSTERKTNTFNDLVQEVALEQGIEGVVSYIEPGAPDVNVMKEAGREYVDYRRQDKKPTDKTKEEIKEGFQKEIFKAVKKVKKTPHKVGDRVYYNAEGLYGKYTKIEDFVESTITDVSDVDFFESSKKVGSDEYTYSVRHKYGNKVLTQQPISKADFESIKKKYDAELSELEKSDKLKDDTKPTDETKETELSVKEQTIKSLKDDLKGEFVSEEAKKEIQEKIDKLEAEVKEEQEKKKTTQEVTEAEATEEDRESIEKRRQEELDSMSKIGSEFSFNEPLKFIANGLTETIAAGDKFSIYCSR
jgi:hypothetical protein